jgi:hypothetical protein
MLRRVEGGLDVTRSGMLERCRGLSVRSAEINTGRAAFFAPLIRTSPVQGLAAVNDLFFSTIIL